MVRGMLRTRVAFLLLCLTCVSVENLMAKQAGQAEAFTFEGAKLPAGEQRGFLGKLLQRILPKYKKLELQGPVQPIALSELGNAAFAVLKVQEDPAYGWLAEDISQRLERVKSAGNLNGAEREFKELLNAAMAVGIVGPVVSASKDLEKTAEELRGMLETTKRALDDQEVLSETLAGAVNQYSALAKDLYRQEWMRDRGQEEVNEEYAQGNLLQLFAARVGQAAEELRRRLGRGEKAEAGAGDEWELIEFPQISDNYVEVEPPSVSPEYVEVEPPSVSPEYVEVESPSVSPEYKADVRPQAVSDEDWELIDIPSIDRDDWKKVEPFIEKDVDDDYRWIGRESELPKPAPERRRAGVQLLPEQAQQDLDALIERFRSFLGL